MSPEPDSKRYLYEQIYSELKQEILSGTYRKGDWFPSERVLKDRFKTTHLTVRNALAKLVLEGYIERYSGKGTIVIYARESSSPPRRVLSFPWAHLICSELDEANARLLESLEARMRTVPLPVRFSCHRGDVLLAAGLYREARKSDALVVLQPATLAEPPDLPGESLQGTIVIGSFLEKAACPQVVIDEAAGAQKAVTRLHGAGYKEMALFIAGPTPVRAGLVQGFTRGISLSGLPAGAGRVESCVPGAEGGVQATRNVLAQRPECRAFLCSSDETAAGTMRALRDAGRTPGADCAVVGWGNTRIAQALDLTSVDPGFDRLSERVLALISEAMERGNLPPEAFRITPELCVRAS